MAGYPSCSTHKGDGRGGGVLFCSTHTGDGGGGTVVNRKAGATNGPKLRQSADVASRELHGIFTNIFGDHALKRRMPSSWSLWGENAKSTYTARPKPTLYNEGRHHFLHERLHVVFTELHGCIVFPRPSRSPSRSLHGPSRAPCF